MPLPVLYTDIASLKRCRVWLGMIEWSQVPGLAGRDMPQHENKKKLWRGKASMAIFGLTRRAAILLTSSRSLPSLPTGHNGESNTPLVHILVMESRDSCSFVRAYIPKI
jgi:hypothetical protein